MNPDERREGFRVPRAFLARFKPKGHHSWFISPLRDLSQGGARFLSEYTEFKPGDRIALQLVLSSAPKGLVVHSTIKWARPSKMPSIIEVGVAFDVKEPAIQAAIERASSFFDRRKQQ